MPGEKVLVVEDDDTVRQLLRLLLEDDGYRVVEATNGLEAVDACSRDVFELVLLDVRMPEMNGFDACRAIRADSDVPVVFLSAHDDSHDIVVGLELGADDYITKPFVDQELLARVRAQLRRFSGRIRDRPDHIAVGDLDIRPAEGLVLKAGQPVRVTKTEFLLLCFLASNPQRIFTRDQLLEQVWGYEEPGDTRLVDAHIRRLRLKIERDPAMPTVIVTVRGLGYKLSR